MSTPLIMALLALSIKLDAFHYSEVGGWVGSGPSLLWLVPVN